MKFHNGEDRASIFCVSRKRNRLEARGRKVQVVPQAQMQQVFCTLAISNLKFHLCYQKPIKYRPSLDIQPLKRRFNLCRDRAAVATAVQWLNQSKRLNNYFWTVVVVIIPIYVTVCTPERHSCGEVPDKWQYVTQTESCDLKGGRGSANAVVKCKLCSRYGHIYSF